MRQTRPRWVARRTAGVRGTAPRITPNARPATAADLGCRMARATNEPVHGIHLVGIDCVGPWLWRESPPDRMRERRRRNPTADGPSPPLPAGWVSGLGGPRGPRAGPHAGRCDGRRGGPRRRRYRRWRLCVRPVRRSRLGVLRVLDEEASQFPSGAANSASMDAAMAWIGMRPVAMS
jgi:hypothetical protein